MPEYIATFTWLITIACAILLLAFVIFAWWGKRVVPLHKFKVHRIWVAVFVSFYALFTIINLSLIALTPGDMIRVEKVEFASYLVFWVLAPPVWFFAEYLAIEKGRIAVANRPLILATAKNYADYASKIWGAVVVLMIALVALKK